MFLNLKPPYCRLLWRWTEFLFLSSCNHCCIPQVCLTHTSYSIHLCQHPNWHNTSVFDQINLQIRQLNEEDTTQINQILQFFLTRYFNIKYLVDSRHVWIDKVALMISCLNSKMIWGVFNNVLHFFRDFRPLIFFHIVSCLQVFQQCSCLQWDHQWCWQPGTLITQHQCPDNG